MTEKLKAVPLKLLEWWNKFTSKQKTIIICISAGVVIALAILVTALTRPQYELLANCESTKGFADYGTFGWCGYWLCGFGRRLSD